MFAQIPQVVRDWYAVVGVDAIVDEEEQAHVAQTNYGPGSANRVVFVTGDESIEIAPPMFIGDDVDGAARQLQNLLYTFTVYFAGFDVDDQRVLAHRRKCIDLYEATVQAIHHACFGLYEWNGHSWNDEKKHLRHGAELVAKLTLNIPIFDAASPSAKPVIPIAGEPKPAT